MTLEEYKEHLCGVIKAVFIAENVVLEKTPSLRNDLKKHKVSPDVYLELIADEMLSKTPEEELKKILEAPSNSHEGEGC